mgnify:CR=1 FL=1
MITRKTPDLENKLLILLAIDQLGPLTGLQLLQFLAERGLMDYFILQLTLGDLKDTGHIERTQSALGPQYALTAAGRESLALFLHRLPYSIRSVVREAAPQWKPRIQREAQILSDFSRREDGQYALRLRLMEADTPILDMTLSLPSRDSADRLARRWPAAAQEFYGFLMKELGDNFSPEADGQVQLPRGACVTGTVQQGFILQLAHEESSVQPLSLSLSLPTQSMAFFFAGRWPEKAEDISAFLMNLLTKVA